MSNQTVSLSKTVSCSQVSLCQVLLRWFSLWDCKDPQAEDKGCQQSTTLNSLQLVSGTMVSSDVINDEIPAGRSEASWFCRTRSWSLCVYISSSGGRESLSSSSALYIYPTDREPRRTDTHSGGPTDRQTSRQTGERQTERPSCPDIINPGHHLYVTTGRPLLFLERWLTLTVFEGPTDRIYIGHPTTNQKAGFSVAMVTVYEHSCFSHRYLLQTHLLLTPISFTATVNLQRHDLPMAANISEDLKHKHKSFSNWPIINQ